MGGGRARFHHAAINGAVTSGRGGLGAVVLFATANDNGAVANPANNAQTIAVGASSMCDQRKSPTSRMGKTVYHGTNYVTAPSENPNH
ncbi:MAG: hypothetical protein IPH36_20245 [Saprospiraceae bacterium]|nr:hypothetical protein [Saprospiraceae bacterium]